VGGRRPYLGGLAAEPPHHKMADAVDASVRQRAEEAKAALEAQLAKRREDLAARSARRDKLQAALAAAADDGTRAALVREADARERELARASRKRYTVADFEPLAVIGRGAFGEVRGGAGWALGGVPAGATERRPPWAEPTTGREGATPRRLASQIPRRAGGLADMSSSVS
jgi:hypothetical protein